MVANGQVRYLFPAKSVCSADMIKRIRRWFQKRTLYITEQKETNKQNDSTNYSRPVDIKTM